MNLSKILVYDNDTSEIGVIFDGISQKKLIANMKREKAG